MREVMGLTLAVFLVFLGCGEKKNGPKIKVENYRLLCGDYNVSGETEQRCITDVDCPPDALYTPFCWRPPQWPRRERLKER